MGISNYIPQWIAGCNYLSQPEIPASGNKVLISGLEECGAEIPTKWLKQYVSFMVAILITSNVTDGITWLCVYRSLWNIYIAPTSALRMVKMNTKETLLDRKYALTSCLFNMHLNICLKRRICLKLPKTTVQIMLGFAWINKTNDAVLRLGAVHRVQRQYMHYNCDVFSDWDLAYI